MSPWSSRLKDIVFEKSILIRAAKDAVWRFIADTDRLNREVGLPSVLFTFEPSEQGGTKAFGKVCVAGMTLQYREFPFEWVSSSYHRVRRRFTGGPVKEAILGVNLENHSEGTLIVTHNELVPSGATGAAFCRILGLKAMADLEKACKAYEEYLAGRNRTAYPNHSQNPRCKTERLSQVSRDLLEVTNSKQATQVLIDQVQCLPPENVLNLRPYAIADEFGIDRREMLEASLLAVQTGLLDLNWRVLCPYCRGAISGRRSIRDLAANVHCGSCNILYDSAFDQNVEVVFSVNKAVRPVDDQTYCIGGPMLSPHALAQWFLFPGESRESTVDAHGGSMRLVSLQVTNSIDVTVSENGVKSVSVVVADGLIKMSPANPVAPNATWKISNESEHEVTLRLESPMWRNDCASAAAVTSMELFRERFSSEVLAPDTEVAVKRICVLFTDLKGSTAMYSEKGDAPSYRVVREHFEFMRKVVRKHNGGVVKTIGDAIMATFVEPTDAVQAALEIQADGNKQWPIKVGVHWGSAIVVNANDVLDYFGQTVNIAARVQNESEGGDIVMTAELAGDASVSQILASSSVQAIQFVANLKGVSERVNLVRIVPSGVAD